MSAITRRTQEATALWFGDQLLAVVVALPDGSGYVGLTGTPTRRRHTLEAGVFAVTEALAGDAE